MNTNGRAVAAVTLATACLLAAGAASAGGQFQGSGWNSGGLSVKQTQSQQFWEQLRSDNRKDIKKNKECKANCARDKPSVVPIPAAAWLFGSGLLGMAGIGYRRRSKTA